MHIARPRGIAWIALLATLQGCSPTLKPSFPAASSEPVPVPTAQHHSVPTRADFGSWTLQRIEARYNDRRTNCGGGADSSADRCTGLLIRATDSGGKFHVWNPSPNSVTRGGVSFSWLSVDVNFAATTNIDGLIFDGIDTTPWSTERPRSLCSFPLNAVTASGRQAPGGCGQRANVPASASCQSQGVQTGQAWVTHFSSKAGSNTSNQCGFFLTPDIPGGAAAGFSAFVDARKAYANAFNNHDELVVATWPQDRGAALPWCCFYYLQGKTGKPNAQHNQLDLLRTDGIAVPIVKVTLPTDKTGQASFAVDPADQVIEAPALPASISQSPSVPLAPFGYLALADILAHDTLAVAVPRLSNAQPGDAVSVQWQTHDRLYLSPSRPLSTSGVTTVPMPRGAVLDFLGRTVEVSYRITSVAPAAVERASTARTIVVDDAPMRLPPPIVGSDQRRVTVDYPDMAAGDDVYLYYYGRDPSPKIAYTRVQAVRPITTLIGGWLDGVPGRIHYTVTRGDTTVPSPEITVGILPRPVIDGMVGGWLYLPDLASDPTVHVPPWEAIANGQHLWLDAVAYYPDGSANTLSLLDGVIVDDTLRHDGADAALPRLWLRDLVDGATVQLLASTDNHGGGRHQATSFTVTRFTVRGTEGPMTTRPLPRLVRVDTSGSVATIDGVLSLTANDDTLQIRVAPWPGMLAGQTVWLTLRGRGGDVALLTAHPVINEELTKGLIVPVDRNRFATLDDGARLDIELKVGFEKSTDAAKALRFPVEHLALRK